MMIAPNAFGLYDNPGERRRGSAFCRGVAVAVGSAAGAGGAAFDAGRLP
jgi:hypothetical protein